MVPLQNVHSKGLQAGAITYNNDTNPEDIYMPTRAMETNSTISLTGKISAVLPGERSSGFTNIRYSFHNVNKVVITASLLFSLCIIMDGLIWMAYNTYVHIYSTYVHKIKIKTGC